LIGCWFACGAQPLGVSFACRSFCCFLFFLCLSLPYLIFLWPAFAGSLSVGVGFAAVVSVGGGLTASLRAALSVIWSRDVFFTG